MELPFGADVEQLRPLAHKVEFSQRSFRLEGTSAYVNTSSLEGTVSGLFWATSERALLRVLDGTQQGVLEMDDGDREASPPICLLPKLADMDGTWASVSASLKGELGQVRESAVYRITIDGKFLYRELGGGRSGFDYRYRDSDGDDDKVAVIGIGLARPDWKPDRSAFSRR